MSGTNRITDVPSLAREIRCTCQKTRNLEQNDGAIKKIWCMYTCRGRHKRENNLENSSNLINKLNFMINKYISICTHRCEVCEKNNLTKTEIKMVTQLHLYLFPNISLSGFQRKQQNFLPKILGKFNFNF